MLRRGRPAGTQPGEHRFSPGLVFPKSSAARKNLRPGPPGGADGRVRMTPLVSKPHFEDTQ